MKYYYVTFLAMGGGTGVRVIPHKPNPFGFNITDATRYIGHTIGVPVIVLTWTEISKHRFDEFKAFVALEEKNCPHHGEKKEKAKLTLVTHPEEE